MNPNEADQYLDTIGNKLWRLENWYKIRDKHRKTVNLILNPIQRFYWNTRSQRDYILKARKIGFSTLCLIDDLDDAVVNRNFTSFIMAHKREDVQKLFTIVQFAYDLMPAAHKPKSHYYNKNELYFKEQNSRIYVGMEARSDTVNKLHVSEFAFVENVEKKLAATFEAIPQDGGIVLETTPNGLGNYSYNLWQYASGYRSMPEGQACEFKPHFFPWFKHPEYQVKLTRKEQELVSQELYCDRDEEEFRQEYNLSYEQMKWRKLKQARLQDEFEEQYPENDMDCFIGSGQPYFDMKALKGQLVEV